MSSRSSSFLALAWGASSVLGTLTLAYGLVYPSAAHGSKVTLAWALFGGGACVLLALLLGLAARRRAQHSSERFFSILSLVVCAFFLFVVAVGFGVPVLVLGVHD